MTRAPRPRRSILFATVITALLAFPAGIVLAAHQFGDVPNTNAFHADIDALVDAGVTAGCGNNNYCPKANVTREQMAAFMNRLGALAPGKTPVVNADRVDGYHANELVRFARGQTGATTTLGTTAVSYGGVSITAPAAGFVLVTAAPAAINDGCTTGCAFFHQLRHVQTGAVSFWGMDDVDTTYGSAPVTWVFPVAAGDHVFQSMLSRPSGDGAISGWWNTLTASYSPYGSTGGGTLEVPQAPVEMKPLPSE